jgi:hypothetical protein
MLSMFEPEAIEVRIGDCLQSVARKAHGQNWSDAQWTREVKTAMALLGQEWASDVWARDCDCPVKGGEWLFDEVWLTYRDRCLVDVPLVMESEWNPKGVFDDFEKLLVARAKYRVLVFSATTCADAAKSFEEFEQRVRQFEFTTPGDRYLFACWTNETDLFIFKGFRA